GIEELDQAAFQREPDQEEDDGHEEDGPAEPHTAGEEDRKIGGDQIERAMGEVHDTERAEDEGEAERNQRIDRAELQPGQHHQEDAVYGHPAPATIIDKRVERGIARSAQ